MAEIPDQIQRETRNPYPGRPKANIDPDLKKNLCGGRENNADGK